MLRGGYCEGYNEGIAMRIDNTFGARGKLTVAGRDYEIYRLEALEKSGLPVARLPYSLKVLLENVLRHEDGVAVPADDVHDLTQWRASELPSAEIAFTPARVLLQDFTGVPAIVDLAAMRDAMSAQRGDPRRINPLQPVELVIDHSVQVDAFGTRMSFETNVDLEYERNRERYAFLRWGQIAFKNFRVVPPGTGIVHQVNLEYLARVVFGEPNAQGVLQAYPDTLVGTDSHTTMVNGLGVLGWGVGGIEAEAAMLGQAVSMLVPQVVGFRLSGELPEGSTATDLVLTVTEMLRNRGVVGKFVEFYGPGLATLPLADRATIGNMAPEYGATCGIFPVDEETLRYLRLTGRSDAHVHLVEAYMKEQGLFHTRDTAEPEYSDKLALDLATVVPSLAGPRRPQDRVPLSNSKASFTEALRLMLAAAAPKPAKEQVARWETEGGEAGGLAVHTAPRAGVTCKVAGQEVVLHDGSVVIAAITSCTNTSNPSVMIAAGLLAKKAVERGLRSKPWVKTSLAPGSKVVTEYYNAAGLQQYLDALGFTLVGYGCTTCIGNSGPLPDDVARAIEEGGLVVASVLSGNRNFEGRINPDVRANYLASPPLCVVYALTGRMDIDLYNEPLGTDQEGRSVFLRDIWPTQHEVQETILSSVRAEMFRSQYASVFEGDERWRGLPVPEGERFEWEPDSTYVRNPPYFVDMPEQPGPAPNLSGLRVLAFLGDSITTDHISPAGSIKKDSPAGRYLIEHGIAVRDFNSYGSRRGNHEVMARGTFANVRIRNQLVPGVEGGYTRYLPTGEQMTMYDAAMRYMQTGTGLMVIAGKEYGTGSSRDWAAKGPMLLGIKAVIAESFERIHRSNLIGMGMVPLQFSTGQSADSLGLSGEETYDVIGLREAIADRLKDREVTVRATRANGIHLDFRVLVRIDTPQELEYYRHGGILQYVLRELRRKA
jgi:aconitate hydratase